MFAAFSLLLSLAIPTADARPRPQGRDVAAVCDRCHGPPEDGAPTAAPHLTGLSRSYLTRQIQDFLKGTRHVSAAGGMCSIDDLAELQPIDFIRLLDHYSKQPPVIDERAPPDAELVAQGESLYRQGQLQLGVQPCAACHGHDATGGVQKGLESGLVAPSLASQDRAYILDQLRSFKVGKRSNDYNGIMQRMVQGLEDDEFLAVAAYLSTLDPSTVPPPAPRDTTQIEMPQKAALCQVCHGVGGESVAETFPKIGGLSKGHLVKQLTDIKETKRTVDVMTPIVFALTDADINEIAAYFAQFEMHRGPYDTFKARRGEELFLKGNLVTGYPACMYCHGVDGKGLSDIEWSPGDIPQLAGQHPGYIKKALYDFKAATRTNDHEGMMRNIARQMTDQEIDDVAHYLYSMGEAQ